MRYSIPDPRTCTGADMIRFAAIADREDLITFCQRNDSNGCWSDDDNVVQFGEPCPTTSLREVITQWGKEES